MNHYTAAHLTLKPLQRDDYPFIRILVNTPGWIRFIGDRNIHSDEEALAYIDRILSTPSILYWVVSEIETGNPVGIISFISRAYLKHWDIGFALLPGYEGRGYAYEAAKTVLNDQMSKPEHETVLATTIPDNVSSIRLLNKLGFEFECEILGDETLLRLYKITN